jgi:hypothetical protein
MGARRDGSRDFLEMQGHRLGVARRQHKRSALAFLRTDGAENVGRGGSLVMSISVE